MFQAQFYLEQNEDCSLGDGISDGSEKLLQKSKGGDEYICDYGESGIHAVKHIFFQKASPNLMKLSASLEKQSSP